MGQATCEVLMHLITNSWLDYRGEDYDFSSDGYEEEDNVNREDESEEWKLEGQAYGEMRQVQCLEKYRTELEFYRRARQHHVEGMDVPCLINAVRVPPGYTSKHCRI